MRGEGGGDVREKGSTRILTVHVFDSSVVVVAMAGSDGRRPDHDAVAPGPLTHYAAVRLAHRHVLCAVYTFTRRLNQHSSPRDRCLGLGCFRDRSIVNIYQQCHAKL